MYKVRPASLARQTSSDWNGKRLRPLSSASGLFYLFLFLRPLLLKVLRVSLSSSSFVMMGKLASLWQWSVNSYWKRTAVCHPVAKSAQVQMSRAQGSSWCWCPAHTLHQQMLECHALTHTALGTTWVRSLLGLVFWWEDQLQRQVWGGHEGVWRGMRGGRLPGLGRPLGGGRWELSKGVGAASGRALLMAEGLLRT